MKFNIFLITDLFLVVFFGLIQSLPLISFYGVKPDLLLSLLVVFLFFTENFWQYFILVLAGSIALKYSTTATFEVIVFVIIMTSAFYLKKYFSTHEFLAILGVTMILSVLFYGIINYTFIVNDIYRFVLEIIYNILASVIFWLILDNANKNNASF
ncbi:MAG: hypothetical protein M1155_02765 [Patescibacteria group bacterium]|nr:hypothetical protein [Patescibacteria group bacterium]